MRCERAAGSAGPAAPAAACCRVGCCRGTGPQCGPGIPFARSPGAQQQPAFFDTGAPSARSCTTSGRATASAAGCCCRPTCTCRGASRWSSTRATGRHRSWCAAWTGSPCWAHCAPCAAELSQRRAAAAELLPSRRRRPGSRLTPAGGDARAVVPCLHQPARRAERAARAQGARAPPPLLAPAGSWTSPHAAQGPLSVPAPCSLRASWPEPGPAAPAQPASSPPPALNPLSPLPAAAAVHQRLVAQRAAQRLPFGEAGAAVRCTGPHAGWVDTCGCWLLVPKAAAAVRAGLRCMGPRGQRAGQHPGSAGHAAGACWVVLAAPAAPAQHCRRRRWPPQARRTWTRTPGLRAPTSPGSPACWRTRRAAASGGCCASGPGRRRCRCAAPPAQGPWSAGGPRLLPRSNGPDGQAAQWRLGAGPLQLKAAWASWLTASDPAPLPQLSPPSAESEAEEEERVRLCAGGGLPCWIPPAARAWWRAGGAGARLDARAPRARPGQALAGC